MTVFETIRKNLAMCLYYPNETHLFDKRRMVVIFVGFLVDASLLAFIVFEANSMEEYAFSAYFVTAFFGIFGSFIHTSTRTPTIFVIIDKDVEEEVNERKFEINTFQFADIRNDIHAGLSFSQE